MSITSKNYNSFQKAYAFFNRKLFNGDLPECMITLQRTRSAYGYFWAGQFAHRGDHSTTDEIALNPEGFKGRSDEAILSTLVHEMCHLWQQHFGKPSRAAYHNSEWAAKMIAVGLQPTDNGLATGKLTGQNMTHLIIADGSYQKAYKRLVSQRGFKLTWETIQGSGKGSAGSGKGSDEGEDEGSSDPKAKKRASKTKYTCPVCGQNAWAKPDALLICGHCFADGHDGNDLEVVTLIAEN